MTKSVEGSVAFVSSPQLRNATDCAVKGTPVTLVSRKFSGILVRNAIKTYGVRKNQFLVLNGIDMSVKKGTM
jgi:hypothetical protein